MSTQSKCIYCGLTLRGPSCPFAPNKIHIHATKDKCVYCGLTLRGPGCAYAPNGVHMRFIDFGQIQAEQTRHALIFGYLNEKLHQPFTDTRAYQLGIIDDKGLQIKTPETVMEHASFTPIDRFVFRLKRSFGDRLSTLNMDQLIESAYSFDTDYGADSDLVTPEQYSEMLDNESNLKKELENLYCEFYNVLKRASDNGIPTTRVENILLEVVSTNADEKSSGG